MTDMPISLLIIFALFWSVGILALIGYFCGSLSQVFITITILFASGIGWQAFDTEETLGAAGILITLVIAFLALAIASQFHLYFEERRKR